MTRGVLRKVFPDHWSFLLGEIALFCYVVLVATGRLPDVLLLGRHPPDDLQRPVRAAQGRGGLGRLRLVMRLSFEVRAGLLMRQIHHWAAVVFVAAIVVHAARMFFTGAFRRPREINWLVGVRLLLLALGAGLTGYSLPDDLLSGRASGSCIRSRSRSRSSDRGWPTWSSAASSRRPDLIGRFYVFHIMLIPALMIGLITVHLLILWLQKHTQFPGGRATEENVVGRHLWPGQAFRSLGLLFLTAAVLAGFAGLVQINPVWVYGPFVPVLGQLAGAAGLVSRLARGLAAARPELRADDPRRDDPEPVRARHPAARGHLRGVHAVAVPRGAVHPRPR